MDCEITGNVGLRILLVDRDTTSLSNLAIILEEHSFKVTAIKQATIALSILREQIDQFDLVMVDVNMLEMSYLEFIKSTQLIKDKPIILMSPEVTIEMVKEATTQGACLIFHKSSISSMKLKDLWKHVKNYNNKAKEESKITIERPQKKRRHLQWTRAPNVQPTTTMNFNEERHSNVLDSGDLSANFNELFQGADIPQPPEVPFVASPSTNAYSLNECDDWINELLQLDDFELKLC